MRFVDDDEPQMGHRGEDCRTRAHDDGRLPADDAFVLARPLSGREPAVQHAHARAQPRSQTGDGLHGEGDLGNEHDGSVTAAQDVVQQGEVDLGLAAARHAPQEPTHGPGSIQSVRRASSACCCSLESGGATAGAGAVYAWVRPRHDAPRGQGPAPARTGVSRPPGRRRRRRLPSPRRPPSMRRPTEDPGRGGRPASAAGWGSGAAWADRPRISTHATLRHRRAPGSAPATGPPSACATRQPRSPDGVASPPAARHRWRDR